MNQLRLIPGLHRATHSVGLELQASRPRLGVTQGEAHLLAHLAAAGPSTIAELHAAFAHRRSTLTSILDRLEARDLAARELRPDDRRSFRVSLTRQGRRLAARVHRALRALEASVQTRVGPAELSGFEAVVRAIQAATQSAASSRRVPQAR
jgi:DNA-binding MarR family transcriptional regulator